MSDADFEGWVPIDVEWPHGVPRIDWRLFGRRRFVEPFFDDTVAKALAHPFSRAFARHTDVRALEDWALARPGLTPSGFIFHMSRCGSTLASQMLAARSDSIVLAEAPPVDALLRAAGAKAEVPEADRIRWLRALFSAYAQPKAGERHFFVKFDCWHALSLPLIRRAFPDTPWIFLYREPREVLASHLRRRGAQTVAGLLDSRIFGIDPDRAVHMPGAEYCARVLGAVCDAAAAEPGGLRVNYRQLPGALAETILPHFGVATDPEAEAAMEAAARRNAKNPSLTFSPGDDAEPIAPDSPAEAAAAAFMSGPYAALERRRAADVVS